MRVYITGRGYTDAPDDLPLLVTYDPTNPHAEQAGPNQGCPSGYVTQWRSGGRQGNYPVCRLATEQYMTDPTIQTRETGLIWADYIVIVDDAIISSVPQVFSEGIPSVATWIATTAGGVAGAALAPLTAPLASLGLIIAAAAALLFAWKK